MSQKKTRSDSEKMILRILRSGAEQDYLCYFLSQNINQPFSKNTSLTHESIFQHTCVVNFFYFIPFYDTLRKLL